jgi:hypothetical protein
MRLRALIPVVLTLVAPVVLAQQTPPAPPPDQPRGLAPNLGRPSRPGDEVPLFDFERYFLGTWSFEADAPDSVLGPGGMSKGDTTYTKIDDGFYAAITTVRREAGPFTIKETIAYRPEAKTAFRTVTDSRGFSYVEMAEVGGNIGGDYSLFFTSAPFVYKGKTIRMTHRFAITAPLVHRIDIDISVDGGRFTHMSPWRFTRIAGR